MARIKTANAERSKGNFTGVEVTIGRRAGEFYPVLKGLNEGDLVAVRGTANRYHYNAIQPWQIAGDGKVTNVLA